MQRAGLVQPECGLNWQIEQRGGAGETWFGMKLERQPGLELGDSLNVCWECEDGEREIGRGDERVEGEHGGIEEDTEGASKVITVE